MSDRVDRIEFKFLINRSMRKQLIEEIRKHTTCDAASGVNHYPIISQYYDNEMRDCYWEKQRGQKSRRKLRIRVYGSEASGQEPTTFIEVKHKHYGRGVKRRLRVTTAEALDLVEGDGAGILATIGERSRSERMIIREIRQLVEERQFKFLCTMRYDREVYVGKEDAPDLRVTFDSGIGCRFEHQPIVADTHDFQHFLLPEEQSVLEVKTNTVIPTWLRNLIGEHCLVRQSYSKFCTALERHDPSVRDIINGPDAIPFAMPVSEICSSQMLIS